MLPVAGQARGSQRGAPGEGKDTPARAELSPVPQPPLPGTSCVTPMHPPRLFFTLEVKSWDGQEAGGGKSAVGWRQWGRGEASKGPELRAEPGGLLWCWLWPLWGLLPTGFVSQTPDILQNLHRDTPNSLSSGAPLQPDFPGDELAAPGEQEPCPGGLQAPDTPPPGCL